MVPGTSSMWQSGSYVRKFEKVDDNQQLFTHTLINNIKFNLKTSRQQVCIIYICMYVSKLRNTQVSSVDYKYNMSTV